MGDKGKKTHHCPHKGCDSSFYRPYRLAQHILVHNNVKAYLCLEEDCAKSYTSKSHLDRHINSVHKNPEKTVMYRVCQIGQRYCRCKTNCPSCMKKYANRQNLKRHIRVHHMLKVPFSCDTCKLEFRKKNHLSAHMYGHTGIKAFSCGMCSEDFVTLFDKKRHLRFHKTFTCDKCPVKFNQWSKYQKHLNTEHVIKEFHCNECGRFFKQRSHMVRHVKTHDAARSFPCPYENCKRFYSRNSNLRQHIKVTHHNIKHECTLCEAKLSTKAKLDQHIMKLHGQNERKIRIPKTRATGRRPRKDIGTTRKPMALKLAGLAKAPEELCEIVMEPSASPPDFTTDESIKLVKVESEDS